MPPAPSRGRTTARTWDPFECGARHGHIVFMSVEADGTGILADIAFEERPAPRLAKSAALSVNRHKS
jgi:hypothetical protein